MLIGVDARNLEGNRTGVGRVLFNIIRIWTGANYKLSPYVKFVLYFKDVIPDDLPKSPLLETKLLSVKSTAKFIHWDLCRAARKDKVDLLFCPEYVGPIFYKGKIAVLLHDISYEAHPEWFNWPSQADRILLKWVSKKIAKKAAIVFVPVKFVKNEVIKYYHIPPEKIVVIGEGVDPVILETSGQSLADIKSRYGIKKKFIFYMGQIFSRRHLPEVIEAFVRLRGKDFDWQLLVAGKDRTAGAAADQLVESTNKKLARNAILRADFIPDPDLKLLFGGCKFFIWLSDYEGFGLPPLEAMKCGAPVITSASSSLLEVAGDAAILIKDNGNVEEITGAMEKIMSDENFCAQMVKNGLAQAAKFTWQNCAEKTLNAILGDRLNQ